jgi:hypothetical protein
MDSRVFFAGGRDLPSRSIPQSLTVKSKEHFCWSKIRQASLLWSFGGSSLISITTTLTPGRRLSAVNDLGLHEKMLMEKSDVNHIDYCAIVSYFKPRFTGLKGLP